MMGRVTGLAARGSRLRTLALPDGAREIMRRLPDGVSEYARTREFSEASIPANLLRRHRTSTGAWARIVVLDGRLRLRILEPEVEEVELSAGRHGVVEPQVAHEVEPLGRVRFHIEFWR